MEPIRQADIAAFTQSGPSLANAVIEEDLQHPFERQDPRHPVHQREQLDAERRLQGRVFVQAVEGLLWLCATLELYDDGHPALV